MTAISVLKPLPLAERSQQFDLAAVGLTAEQFACLCRCARGISLRFEASDVVDALVAGGYSRIGLVRVVTMTARGREYLQEMHAAQDNYASQATPTEC